MRIGDKVRLLKGTEEGVIVEIKGNIVEIEIEDGFSIPAVKNEVVVIDRKEAEAFDIEDETKPAQQSTRQTTIEEGIYLGLDDESKLDCYIINQTANPILFSVSIIEKKNQVGLAYGICDGFDAKELGETHINPNKGEIQFHLQVIIHERSSKFKKPPVEANLTIKQTQLKEKVIVMSLEKALSLFNLEKISYPEIDAEKIKEQLIEGSGQSFQQEVKNQSKEQIIDLHIDPANINLPENEILRYQLELFEKSFDQAILSNAKSLKVIHGIGIGKLRNEIHKRISRQSEVKYFEDGDKEKFGFGSTIIYF